MRTFRLKQQSFIVGEENEDGGGSTTNITESRGSTFVLWRGECEEEPNSEFFLEVGVEMPENTGEEHGGEPSDGFYVGDAEYNYVLEELIDGKWQYRNHLHAVRD